MTLNSATPEFWLSQLEAGSTFVLSVQAVNVKGVSAPLILPVSTLKEAAKRTVPPAAVDAFGGGVAGAVALGTGAAVLLAGAVAGAVACRRCHRLRSTPSTPPPPPSPPPAPPLQPQAPLLQRRSDSDADYDREDEDAAESGFYRPTPLPTPHNFAYLSVDVPESRV